MLITCTSMWGYIEDANHFRVGCIEACERCSRLIELVSVLSVASIACCRPGQELATG